MGFGFLPSTNFLLNPKLLHPHLNPLPRGGRGRQAHDHPDKISMLIGWTTKLLLKTLSLAMGEGRVEGSNGIWFFAI